MNYEFFVVFWVAIWLYQKNTERHWHFIANKMFITYFTKNIFWQQDEVWLQYYFGITEHAQTVLPSGDVTFGLTALLLSYDTTIIKWSLWFYQINACFHGSYIDNYLILICTIYSLCQLKMGGVTKMCIICPDTPHPPEGGSGGGGGGTHVINEHFLWQTK